MDKARADEIAQKMMITIAAELPTTPGVEQRMSGWISDLLLSVAAEQREADAEVCGQVEGMASDYADVFAAAIRAGGEG